MTVTTAAADDAVGFVLTAADAAGLPDDPDHLVPAQYPALDAIIEGLGRHVADVERRTLEIAVRALDGTAGHIDAAEMRWLVALRERCALAAHALRPYVAARAIACGVTPTGFPPQSVDDE